MIFKNLTILLLSVCLSGLVGAAPLKAMTWNIEWFPGGRPNASKSEKQKQTKLVKEVLINVSPDILLLQEVTDERAVQKVLKTLPGYELNVFSQFPERDSDKPGKQQCAIASRLKADSAWFESFAATDHLPNLRRGFAFAALEHPDGGLIMVYSIHLKSNYGSHTPEGEKDVADTRAESIRQIVAHKAAMEEKFTGKAILGWLVGGDFNTNDDGQFPMCTAVADLMAAGFHNTWDMTPKKDRLTWHNPPNDNRFKPTTFDYMLTTGFQKVQASVPADVPRKSSDHDPVVLMLSAP